MAEIAPGVEGPLAARAFIILHETFHLQQSWAAVADGSSTRQSMLPKGFEASERVGESIDQLGAGSTNENIEDKWAFVMLKKSYADIMGACALAGFRVSSAQACKAVSESRADIGVAQLAVRRLGLAAKVVLGGVGMIVKSVTTKSQKKSLGAMGKAVVSWMEKSDPHMTAMSLGLMASAVESLGSDGLGPAAASELAKACAVAGLLAQCSAVLKNPKSYKPALAQDAEKTLRIMLARADYAKGISGNGGAQGARWAAMAAAADNLSQGVMDRALAAAKPAVRRAPAPV